MNKNYLILGGIVAAVVIGSAAVSAFNLTASPASVETVADTQDSGFGKELTEEEIVRASKEMLQILSELHYVTQDTTAASEPESVVEIIMDLTVETLHDKNRIEILTPRVEVFAESENQIVKTTGMGMFVGFKQLAKAEADFAAFLRTMDASNPDTAEFQYQLATFSVAQKEAFKNISIGASTLPAIYWEYSDTTHKPTDPIPYKISRENRLEILAEINRFFGDEIVADDKNHALTGETNAVIFIVKNFIDGLKYETFQEHEAAQEDKRSKYQ
jgi:hypothetical protein